MKTIAKTIFTIYMIVVSISSIKAQVLNGGIIAGVSTGSVKLENVGNTAYNVVQGKNIMGYEGGLFLKLNIARLYIKPIAMLEYRSGQVSYQQNETNAVQTNFNLFKIEAPILIGLRIIGPLSIEAGPVYNYILYSNSTINNTQISMGSNGIGYRVGLAVELGILLIHASYQGDSYNTSSISSATFKEPSKIIFGLGLKFGGSGRK